MDTRPKGNIIGVRVSITDYDKMVAAIIAAAHERRTLLITAADTNVVVNAYSDPAFGAAINHFDFVAPDGQPVRWGLRLTRQAALRDRVYGPTLMLRVCEAAERERLPIFLYGSRERTLELLRDRLLARMPGLRVVGMRSGRFRPLTPEEQAADAAEIARSGAAITFVGMGCPRQEWWIFHMRERISMPMLGVGAAFDFHAGLVRQAPPWLQARGLEWSYRLSREPKRLWRRYLLATPRYIPLIALQALGLRRFPCPSDLSAARARACPG